MKKLILSLLACAPATFCIAQVYYDGTQPGSPIIALNKEKASIGNKVLEVTFAHSDKQTKLAGITINNAVTGYKVQIPKENAFKLVTTENDTLSSNDFVIKSVNKLNTKDQKGINYVFEEKKHNVQVSLKLSLKEGQNYVVQNFDIIDPKKNVVKFFSNIIPADDKRRVEGIVDGSPLVAENLFFAIENPLFKVEQAKGNYYIGLVAPSDDIAKAKFEVNSIIGTTPEGQLRRGFLYYLEQRRARAYKPFLHYNSWYDLSYNADLLKEDDCMDRVHTWIDELTVKRNVHLDGFLWDSGWDDFDHLWKFNQFLPNGFQKFNDYAGKYKTGMGVWLSPWGGYDDAVVARMKGAKLNNPQLELNENGFTVAQPNYYKYFKNTAENFVKHENVKIFKFDGVGAGLKASGPGQKYLKDIESFLSIVKDIRSIQPDTYFSLTVGTWPSPFWLMYGDNIWRGGGDMGYMGKGTKRQRWMNFRDGDLYNNVVKRAPLYPLNAMMTHGLTIGTKGTPKVLENDSPALADDMWAFFATGTSLQEMYVNPHMLKPNDWDELVKVLNFVKSKESTLVDTHWIGGSPEKAEVYGYASWNPKGGVILLRNPSESEVSFNLDLKRDLDLPSSYKQNLSLRNVREGKQVTLNNGNISLKPFEVLVLEVSPR